MRDLIEEYMEEIKQAGGVKSPVRVSEDSGMFPPKLTSGFDIPIETNNSSEASHQTPAVTISNPDYEELQSHTNYSDKSRSIHDGFSRDYDQHKQGHHRSHHAEGQGTADQENHRSRTSTSPERQRRHSRSHERRVLSQGMHFQIDMILLSPIIFRKTVLPLMINISSQINFMIRNLNNYGDQKCEVITSAVSE